jgi:hypothetical protein
MIWHLTWHSPDGEMPVEVMFTIAAVQDGDWKGEIRITGYPAKTPVLPLEGCDWVQALQHFGIWGPRFLWMQLQGDRLTWRGTDIEFTYPEWRRRQPAGLLTRVWTWWKARRA